MESHISSMKWNYNMDTHHKFSLLNSGVTLRSRILRFTHRKYTSKLHDPGLLTAAYRLML